MMPAPDFSDHTITESILELRHLLKESQSRVDQLTWETERLRTLAAAQNRLIVAQTDTIQMLHNDLVHAYDPVPGG